MGKREQRAMAAAETIEVNGRTYKLRPVVVQHLCDLEREALADFKRSYLETFSRNADLLGKNAAEVLERQMEKVASWELDDLPKRTVYDVSSIPVTDGLKELLRKAVGDVPDTDAAVRAVLVTLLDNDTIKPEEVKEATGKYPRKGLVRYDQWWVTASLKGMLSFIYSSIRHEHPEVKLEDIAGWSFAKVAEAARKVEKITSPDVGNG